MLVMGKVPLGEFCTLVKGLSYQGKFLDEGENTLLGIGSILEGGGFTDRKVRKYSGPYKPQHRAKPGDVYVAMTNMAEETSQFLGSTAKVPLSFPEKCILTHHVGKVRWLTRPSPSGFFVLGDEEPCHGTEISAWNHRVFSTCFGRRRFMVPRNSATQLLFTSSLNALRLAHSL